MRRLILAATALTIFAGAGSLVTNRAEAMSIPGGARPGIVAPLAENVALVCTRRFNGRRMVQVCRETRPRVFMRRNFDRPRMVRPRRY